ncbi:histone-lysine N-methyltransferase SETMAR-like [Augochlora pura]
MLVKIGHEMVLNHFHKAGFIKKLDDWVPHQLTQKTMMVRISICDVLAKRNEIHSFLERMVTGGEKWITYDNIVRKRSWSKPGEAGKMVAKPGLTSQEGSAVHLLAIDQRRSELANRRGVVCHRDNVRPHTSIVTRLKIQEFGWDVLMHPPYSLDLAPSDYHVYLAL